MNKKVAPKKAEVKGTIEVSRQSIRDALLGNVPLAKTEAITIYGIDIELRQPTLGAILDAQDEADTKARSADMIIRFACVPGTDERVFEDTDRAMILNWPFGDDMMKLQTAITKLSGVNIDDATDKLDKDPLEQQS